MTSSNLLWYLFPKTYIEKEPLIRPNAVDLISIIKIMHLKITWILAAVFGSRNDLTVLQSSLNPCPALMIYMRHNVYVYKRR